MRVIAVLLTVLLLVWGLTPVQAGVSTQLDLIVDTADDPALNTSTASGDCTTPADSDTCSLREALYVTNTNGNPDEADTITIQVAGPIVLEQTDAGVATKVSASNGVSGGDLDITESVAIDGNGVTVSASGIRAENTHDRVFDIDGRDGPSTQMSVMITDLTVTDGASPDGEDGGGIRVRAETIGSSQPSVVVTLDDVNVTGNLATPGQFRNPRGGGVASDRADLYIRNSTISGNIAAEGGGIAHYGGPGTDGAPDKSYRSTTRQQGSSGSLDLEGVTVSGNDTTYGYSGAPDGGGVAILESYATISYSQIVDNGLESVSLSHPDTDEPVDVIRPARGGGLFSDGGFDINDSLIARNLADEAGGGVWASGDFFSSNLNRSAVVDNAVEPADRGGLGPIRGGGGLAFFDVNAYLDNVTVSGNSASAGSGILGAIDADAGFFISSPYLGLTHVTIAGNEGGAQVQMTTNGTCSGECSPVELEFAFFNSIVQGAGDSSACLATDSDGIQGVFTSLDGNSDSDGSCGFDQSTDAPSTSQQLGSLAANGGQQAGDAPTVAVPTLELLQTAEGVDAGADQPIFSAPTGTPAPRQSESLPCWNTGEDQRGMSRPIDGNGDGDVGCDRGAFERRFVPPAQPGTPDARLDKTGPDSVVLGDPIEFTLTAQGVTGSTRNVVVSDTLPDGLSVVSASDGCTVDGNTVACAFDPLPAPSAVAFTVTAQAAAEGTYTNTACLTGTNDSDGDNNCDDHTVEVVPLDVTRVEGPERISTAVAASRTAFGDGAASAVVLTRDDDFPDAQAGTPLAVATNAPLLLSTTAELPEITAEEIVRVLPAGGTVYLLGGTAALSDAVADDVTELGYVVVRLGGDNRFGTAVSIAGELGDPGTLLIADGGRFAAAVISGVAATVADPAGTGAVLLTSDDNIPTETAAYLAGRADDPTLIAIGPEAARAFPDVESVLGPEDTALSVAVAERFFTDPTAAGVATKSVFPDSLTGGTLVANPAIGPGPILLSDPTDVPEPLADYLGTVAGALTRLFVFGGTAALSPAVEDELNQILGLE